VEVVAALITDVGEHLLVNLVDVLLHRVGDGARVVASGALRSVRAKDEVVLRQRQRTDAKGN
jgi:hypothetical protein